MSLTSNARQRERVGKLGLTIGHASALRELTGPMTLSELAVRMGCKPSNVIVVIDHLELR
jgi:MarR family transcriptional regulator, organic hydroperoxide resistance regulator